MFVNPNPIPSLAQLSSIPPLPFILPPPLSLHLPKAPFLSLTSYLTLPFLSPRTSPFWLASRPSPCRGWAAYLFCLPVWARRVGELGRPRRARAVPQAPPRPSPHPVPRRGGAEVGHQAPLAHLEAPTTCQAGHSASCSRHSSR